MQLNRYGQDPPCPLMMIHLTDGGTMSSPPVSLGLTSFAFKILLDMFSSRTMMSTVGTTVNVTHFLITEESSRDDLSTAAAPQDKDALENVTSALDGQLENATAPEKVKTTSRKATSAAVIKATQGTNGMPQLMTITNTTVALTTRVPRTPITTTKLTNDRQTTMSMIEMTTSEKTGAFGKQSTTSLTTTVAAATQTLKIPAFRLTTTGARSTSTTEVSPLQCNVTEAFWLKTGIGDHYHL